VLLPLIYIAS